MVGGKEESSRMCLTAPQGKGAGDGTTTAVIAACTPSTTTAGWNGLRIGVQPRFLHQSPLQSAYIYLPVSLVEYSFCRSSSKRVARDSEVARPSCRASSLIAHCNRTRRLILPQKDLSRYLRPASSLHHLSFAHRRLRLRLLGQLHPPAPIRPPSLN